MGKDRKLPSEDLDHILFHAKNDLEALRGASIFMTGGTGFVGSWLIHSLLWANEKMNLGLRIVVLTRKPSAYLARYPLLAQDPAIVLLAGDMTRFDYPDGDYEFVVHAATSPYVEPSPELPFGPYSQDVEGTRRVLEFARTRGTKRLLFTSSGAVYGIVPKNRQPISESYPAAPNTTDTRAAYGHGKRISEWMLSMFSQQFGFDVLIARLFAFMGPLLPLDAGFAFGNFLKNALEGGPVRIEGDGKPLRSYLYAADLVVWLLAVLLRGQSARPYHVGSSQAVSIADLAKAIINGTHPDIMLEVASKEGISGHDYVPDVQRAEKELGLRAWISLEDGIRRTREWYEQT